MMAQLKNILKEQNTFSPV